MNDAEALAAFLSDRHVACPNCRYDLHGLGSARCPECNLSLALRVNLVEPRLGLWLAAAVGVSTGIGFHGILLGLVGYSLIVNGLGLGIRDASLLGGGFVMNGVALLVLLRARGPFRRCARPARLALAVGSWAFSLTTAVLFFAFVD
ncbi:MAG: hypothetical protein DHS20C14_05210 [Phycisphaeraceae bacterium]|nr:MAG: hypothetical protein DHS20C14_05210 [Phycisphaeraceae bacterium]